MQFGSLNTVRHDAVPAERVLAAARNWARELRRQHPEIVRIGYFGSYARGNYVPGSDFDVLIEVNQASERRMADRAFRYQPDEFPVGVEIVVYSTEELASLRRRKRSFVSTVEEDLRALT